MAILEQMKRFSDEYGKTIVLSGSTWRYYRIGTGKPVLWLTGGLRRAALGCDFLKRLAEHHLVIAPDYPPVKTIAEVVSAIDMILKQEGIESFSLCGQSYGGILAQAYLTRTNKSVEKLILSSTGPANYTKAWLPVEYFCIGLARLLPERNVKNWLADKLVKLITLPEAEAVEWKEAVHSILQNELTRADVISHFAVAADLIREHIVTPAAYANWNGRAFVLCAENDPTQSAKDIPQYERLFNRKVAVINMGTLGHAAVLVDPQSYVTLLERALE